jgi:steroid delta-isomerase-like uncharacterized protein
MLEENKAVAKRWTEEIFNKGNLAAIDELVAEDFIMHIGSEPELRGHTGLKEYMSVYRTAFPDGRFTIDEQIAEGDKVVQRWTFKGTQKGEIFGIPGTGRSVASTGTTTLRIAGGKVAEHWAHLDLLGWLKQVGKGLS